MPHNKMGAEVRECVEREYEGKPSRGVIASRVFQTDARELWDALTRAERIPRWFLPIEGELRQGGRYQLKGNAGGTILRCDAPRALDITWEFGGGKSWVNLRLAPEGAGTRLTLEHLAHTADIEQFWSQFGPGATGVGWDLGFLGLALHLESGGGVPPEADPAWMASAEAKDFIHASARAWGEAHVAAGEAADVARGMADRTAAFYTGG
jgi:uncharacterized protein YndB with AHSA1/START domain